MTRTRAGRHALGYLVTRAGNGALGLAATAIAIAALGTVQAGLYFVAWTAAWLLSLTFRLGTDSILPRLVAEARLSGDDPQSVRGVAIAGTALTALLTPVTFAALRLPLEPEPMLATGLVAGLWGATFVLGGLMRAHDRVDRSGLATNILWGAGTAAAALLALVVDVEWVGLIWLTAATSAIALAGVVALTVATLGTPVVGGLLAGGQSKHARDHDRVGAAVLSGLTETLVWAPMLLAALLDAQPHELAAIFAATRLAGILSWAYQACVAVLSPRLARALAARDVARARSLLHRGAVIGGAATVPACVAGLLLAPAAVELLLGEPSAIGTAALRLLIVARAIDALCGPLGEALLIGRRAWTDVRLVAVALTVGAGTAALLEPSIGAEAAAAGAAVAFIAANVLRAIVVTRLLQRGWPDAAGEQRSQPWPRSTWAIGAALSLALALVLSLLVYVAHASTATGAAGIILAALLSAVGLLVLGGLRHGRRGVLLSPLVLIALLVLTHFGLRPVALLVDPAAAVTGVAELGVPAHYIVQAAALGILITTALGIGFLLPPSAPSPARGRAALPAERRVRTGVLCCLGAGTVLWATLFMRLGGIDTLTSNPAALHLNQFGGLYGVFGMLLCLAALLVALWSWLQRPTRSALVLVAVAGAVSLAASVALATRGPLVVTSAAAVVLILRERRPSRRAAIAGVLVLACGVMALAFARQTREYAQVEPLGDAVQSAVRTQPLALLSGDLIEFDHFAALTVLVPDPLPWLDGESIRHIPGAFVPRTLWADKPLPIDYVLSEQLYGPTTTAGTPFTIGGELFWNFGVAWAVVLAAIGGFVAGSTWWRLARRTGWLQLVGALMFGYTYLLLTRPLAPMLQTTTFALLALLLVVLAAGIMAPARGVHLLRSDAWFSLRRLLRPPHEPFERP